MFFLSAQGVRLKFCISYTAQALSIKKDRKAKTFYCQQIPQKYSWFKDWCFTCGNPRRAKYFSKNIIWQLKDLHSSESEKLQKFNQK